MSCFAMSVRSQSVLMLGWEYPPHNSGGLGVACEGLTQAMAQQNSQIYFTLPYTAAPVSHMQMLNCADASWEDSEEPPFSSYSHVPTQKNWDPEMLDAKLRTSTPTQLSEYVLGYADAVAANVSNQHVAFDIVHAHDWMTLPAAEMLKKQTNAPVVAHVHSTEFDRVPHGRGNEFIIETEARGFHAVDHIIAVSDYTKRLLQSAYGIASSKISVVHNGVQFQPFDASAAPHFARKRPVVVFMGRLTMQKGAEYFLRLASLVTQKQKDILFIVAGSGDLYHQLLLTTADLGLSASVLFSGFLRDIQRDWLLERADVFVMPSLSEPFGLVALEAAQHNTPVIISKQTGVGEVLPSALQVDFWDMDLLADTVLSLVRDKQQHEAVVAAQQADLPHITWDSAAQKVSAIYQSLLRK